MTALLGCAPEGTEPSYRELHALANISMEGGIAVDTTSSHAPRLILDSFGLIAQDMATHEFSVFAFWRRPDLTPDDVVFSFADVAFSARAGRVIVLGSNYQIPEEMQSPVIGVFDAETALQLPVAPVSKRELPISAPVALAISDAKPDRVWIADEELGVAELDLDTGKSRVLFDARIDDMVPLRDVGGLAVSDDGARLWFCKLWRNQVFALDLESGEMEVASGNATVSTVTSVPVIGEGPFLEYPGAMAWDSDRRRLLVAGRGELMWIDPETGDRQRLTGDGTGSGPELSAPSHIALYDGRAFVTDANLNRVIAVDLNDGSRSIFSEGTAEP